MPDAPQDSDDTLDDLPFEDALAALESVVQEMESEEITLEGLMEHYVRGTRLHRICEKRLDEAQGRIEIIRRRSDGRSDMEVFGDHAPGETTPPAPDPATATTLEKDETDTPSQDGELF